MSRIEALKAEARPGCCICCDAPLRPPRTVKCGEYECERLYNNAARLDWRQRRGGIRR